MGTPEHDSGASSARDADYPDAWKTCALLGGVGKYPEGSKAIFGEGAVAEASLERDPDKIR